MSIRSITGAMAVLMATVAVASAQPASDRTSEPAFGPRVKPGSRVFVIDWAGAEREGKVVSTGQAGIELDAGGSRTTIANNSIARIEKTDGLLNGALIGAAVSIPLGFLNCDEAASKSACWVYGLAGSAGVGALIDRARHGRTILYRGEKPRATRIDWSVTPVRRGFAARIAIRLS